MQLYKMRLQVQPHWLPVLRGRLHDHLLNPVLLKPTHYLVPLIGSGSKLLPLEFHGGPGCVCHLGLGARYHYHQHFLVNINRCYLVRHVHLSCGEVADRASTLNTHRSELSPFLAERQLSLIGSQSAIRISLPDGLNLSRAVTTSATFSDKPIVRQSHAPFSSPLVARRGMRDSVEGDLFRGVGILRLGQSDGTGDQAGGLESRIHLLQRGQAA